ncbi:MAG TPA: hypothetical protein VGG41_12990 [Solirubrobacteraceae bacterium]|jgi:hypothetical protein
MLALRRGYLVALVAVALVVTGYVVVPKVSGSSAPKPVAATPARLIRKLDAAILRRLQVPKDFIPVHSGCTFYPCFRAPRLTTQVAPELAGILASTGAVRASPVNRINGCQITHPDHPPHVLALCTYLGTIDHKTLILFLAPWDPPHCAASKRCVSWFQTQSEVDLALPSQQPAPGAGQAVVP